LIVDLLMRTDNQCHTEYRERLVISRNHVAETVAVDCIATDHAFAAVIASWKDLKLRSALLMRSYGHRTCCEAIEGSIGDHCQRPAQFLRDAFDERERTVNLKALMLNRNILHARVIAFHKISLNSERQRESAAKIF
jgi:hypothetical protein